MAKKKKYYSSSDVMLKEDRSCVANMPKEVIYREYPKYGSGYMDKLADGPDAMRNQMVYDDKAMMRNLSKSKY